MLGGAVAKKIIKTVGGGVGGGRRFRRERCSVLGV